MVVLTRTRRLVVSSFLRSDTVPEMFRICNYPSLIQLPEQALNILYIIYEAI